MSIDTSADKRKSGVVSLIGPANSGKSTLVNRLVGHKVSIVSPKVQTTRQRIMGIKTTDASQVVYVDTPGFFSRKYRGEMSRFLKREASGASEGVDAVLFVVDVRVLSGGEKGISECVTILKNSIAGEQSNVRLPEVWVLNKIDLVEVSVLLPLIASVSEALDAAFGAEYAPMFIPVSARNGSGVEELESEILKRLPEGPFMFPEDMVMEQSDEVFASELIREKAFLSLHQEIPYGLGVLCRSWEDSEKMITIHADIIVEKDSQKVIVLGTGGSMLEKIGTQARKELERLYGQKVLLKLFVRVERNWTRSPQGLIKTGYQLS
jgi:GTPase